MTESSTACIRELNDAFRKTFAGGNTLFVYPKSNHAPATYTMLDFIVPNIDAAVDELASKGVVIEKYEGMHQDEKALRAALTRQLNTNVSDRWNGRIYLSLRRAQEEIGSNREEIARWYRELQYYGFIVMMTPGCLGLEGKGKAPRWRLTELPLKAGEAATKDFLRWNGVKFRDQKKQNPGPEKAAALDRKRQPPDAQSGPEKAARGNAQSGPEKAAMTKSNHIHGPRRGADAPGMVVVPQGVRSLRHQLAEVPDGDDDQQAAPRSNKR
jgi:hypothetical protein